MILQQQFHSPWMGSGESLAGEESPASDETGTTLNETARQEQEYLRQRLREELKREPSEEELSEWLRQHTEGY